MVNNLSEPMFKKIAAFTDLHLGAKGNSVLHNKDCEDFVDWFIKTAQEQGCETGIFLGDYHHNRNNINVNTLSSSVRCLEKLGKAFEKFYFFPGNHDLFFRDKRSVHSVEWGRHIPGVTVVRDITTIGDCTLVPWLVGDEWKKMSKLKSRYVFGHFELPLFYMNAMVQMPDHGELQVDDFKGAEYVFSGHFHKRQSHGNVVYIGNAFPHNYADAWDDERGMMVLEHGGKPQFFNWEDAPKFRTTKLSELIDNADKIIGTNSHLRVNIDIPISFEEASFIKETFMEKYVLRELTMIPEKKVNDASTDVEIAAFESVDQIVSTQITSIQSDSYDPNVLLAIYNNL